MGAEGELFHVKRHDRAKGPGNYGLKKKKKPKTRASPDQQEKRWRGAPGNEKSKVLD